MRVLKSKVINNETAYAITKPITVSFALVLSLYSLAKIEKIVKIVSRDGR